MSSGVVFYFLTLVYMAHLEGLTKVHPCTLPFGRCRGSNCSRQFVEQGVLIKSSGFIIQKSPARARLFYMAHPEGLTKAHPCALPFGRYRGSNCSRQFVEQGFSSNLPETPYTKNPTKKCGVFSIWRIRRDSNPRPSGSKPPTLSS